MTHSIPGRKLNLSPTMNKIASRVVGEDAQHRIDERHLKVTKVPTGGKKRYTDEQYNGVMTDSKFMSHKQLVEKHGVPLSTVVGWVSGLNRNPRRKS
jgi:hypothetical protein